MNATHSTAARLFRRITVAELARETAEDDGYDLGCRAGISLDGEYEAKQSLYPDCFRRGFARGRADRTAKS